MIPKLKACLEDKDLHFILDESIVNLDNSQSQDLYNLFCVYEECLTFPQKQVIL